MEQIGAEFGVSKMVISKRLRKLLDRLRSFMDEISQIFCKKRSGDNPTPLLLCYPSLSIIASIFALISGYGTTGAIFLSLDNEIEFASPHFSLMSEVGTI